jgi:hypothetical protein
LLFYLPFVTPLIFDDYSCLPVDPFFFKRHLPAPSRFLGERKAKSVAVSSL